MFEPVQAALLLALALPDDRARVLALASTEASKNRTAAPGPNRGSPDPDQEAYRLRALVLLACDDDAEAFGQLYDHYVNGVYRFIYYCVASSTLAEDLTSDTFMQARQSITFWQGTDFGAWLATIARDLIASHHHPSRTRLELVTDGLPDRPTTAPGPGQNVLATLTNASLTAAVDRLPAEQRDCVLMRFIQGLSIAETAAAMNRSDGAIKKLQLRAIRNLAKMAERGQ